MTRGGTTSPPESFNNHGGGPRSGGGAQPRAAAGGGGYRGLVHVNAGDFIGTESLWPDLSPSALSTVISASKMKLLRISPFTLSPAASDALRDALSKAHWRYILAVSDALSTITTIERILLVDQIEQRTYTPGQTIVEQGQSGDALMIVASGTAKIRSTFVRKVKASQASQQLRGNDLCEGLAQNLMRCLGGGGGGGPRDRRRSSVRRNSFYGGQGGGHSFNERGAQAGSLGGSGGGRERERGESSTTTPSGENENHSSMRRRRERSINTSSIVVDAASMRRRVASTSSLPGPGPSTVLGGAGVIVGVGGVSDGVGGGVGVGSPDGNGSFGSNSFDRQRHEMSRQGRQSNEAIIHTVLGATNAEKVKQRAASVHTINDVVRADSKPLHPGDCFGEMALRSRAPYEGTVTAVTEVSCLVVSHAAFTQAVGPVESAFLRAKTRHVMARVRDDIAPADVRMVRTIGVGSFASVWMVQHRTSGRAYALKVLAKRMERNDLGEETDVPDQHHEARMNLEKDLLASCDHHLIPRLVASWHSDTHSMLVLELVQGGELFSLLDREGGRLHETAARFYCACVASALCYLHTQGIAYRDLKPENILIDSAGYAKLVDFGFAKVITGRTYTLCGTPGYIPPEVVAGTGHTIACDWWTLGVLAYEVREERAGHMHTRRLPITQPFQSPSLRPRGLLSLPPPSHPHPPSRPFLVVGPLLRPSASPSLPHFCSCSSATCPLTILPRRCSTCASRPLTTRPCPSGGRPWTVAASLSRSCSSSALKTGSARSRPRPTTRGLHRRMRPTNGTRSAAIPSSARSTLPYWRGGRCSRLTCLASQRRWTRATLMTSMRPTPTAERRALSTLTAR